MKKMMALLLVLLLALGCAGAACAELYGEEIRFRGLAWGCTLEDLVSQACVEDTNTSSGSAHDVAYFLYGEADKHKYVTDIVRRKGLPITEAAGYELDGAYLYFVKEPDKNGNVVSADAARLKLIYGEYVVKTMGSGVFDDITAKLTSLYGDVDFTYETEEGNWKGKKAKRTSNVWYGANGTMVSVSYFVGWGTTINYSYEGADELLKNASYGNLSGL